MSEFLSEQWASLPSTQTLECAVNLYMGPTSSNSLSPSIRLVTSLPFLCRVCPTSAIVIRQLVTQTTILLATLPLLSASAESVDKLSPTWCGIKS